MKSVIRPEAWLSFSLLLMLASNSAAQAPQPQLDQPETKLPALLTAKPLTEDPKDDELRKLLKARYNEAVGEVKEIYEKWRLGRVIIEAFADAAQRLVQAGVELYDKPDEKVALLTQFVELTKESVKSAQTLYDAGKLAKADLHRARYQRLDAEIQLLRAKREADKAKGK
jgi:hypothetical protein